MTPYDTRSGFELARRLVLRGPQAQSWLVALLPSSEAEVQAFADEIEANLDVPVSVVSGDGRNASELLDHLNSIDSTAVVLHNLDEWLAEDWSVADMNRTKLSRSDVLAFCMSPQALDCLCRRAPNIRSFVGTGIYVLGEDGGLMTESERQERLSQLSTHFGLSHEDVVRMAESRVLPGQPEFLEWLVLLGRGDLF